MTHLAPPLLSVIAQATCFPSLQIAPTPGNPKKTLSSGLPRARHTIRYLPMFLSLARPTVHPTKTPAGVCPFCREDNQLSQPALLTALRQSTISPKTSTQSTATTSGDDKQVTFEFSRELMLSSHAYKNPVHRLDFWTSFRCALVSDPPITTVGTNPARYDHDYLITPGRLNPELLSLYRQAYQKKTNHPAFHELTTWFETECVTADTDNDNTVLPCHIQPGFFSTSVVQALLSVSFQSGYRLKKGEETDKLDLRLGKPIQLYPIHTR
jgi:hypothetical protein